MLRTVISIVFVATLACAHGPVAKSQAEAVVEVVSRDILKHAREAPEGTYILIVTRTRGFDLREGDAKRAADSGIPAGLLQQLAVDHPHRVTIASGSKEFRPVTPGDIAGIFAEGPRWDRFYERFPNSRGFVEFSGPVFNASATEAVVYVDYNCYGDCGWGSVVYLQHRDGEWVKIHEWLRYIS